MASDLKYDAENNGAKLHGPYFRYDFLNTPYSVGPFKFEDQDLRPSFREVDGSIIMTLDWPRALINKGNINIYDTSAQLLYTTPIKDEEFGKEDEPEKQKKVKKNFSYNLENYPWMTQIDVLKQGFFYCISNKKNTTYIRICSPQYQIENKKIVRKIKSNKVKVLLNEKLVPDNAQIQVSEEMKKIHLIAKFKSGMLIEIQTETKKINLSDIAYDAETKKLSLKGSGATPENAQVTKGLNLKATLIEANRIRELFESSKDWEIDLKSEEIEFFLFDIGADIQMFALIPPPLPENQTPPSVFKDQIATYSNFIDIKGKFPPGNTVSVEPPGEVSTQGEEFDWKFPAPEKSEVNFSKLYLTKGDKKFTYSHKIYRSKSFSVTARVPVTVNSKLETVLGTQAVIDFWPEKIIGTNKASYQRWGFEASYYKNFGEFSIASAGSSTADKFEFSFMSFDIMMRLYQGVRPVESSLGLAARYLKAKINTTYRTPFEPSLIGLGMFWHAAPPGWVDDLLDLYGLFDYPKWMEVSAFYYPDKSDATVDDEKHSNGGSNVSGAWSAHARGRLLFSKSFFFDASINMMSMSLMRPGLDTRNIPYPRDSSISNSVIYGTFGIGWMF